MTDAARALLDRARFALHGVVEAHNVDVLTRSDGRALIRIEGSLDDLQTVVERLEPERRARRTSRAIALAAEEKRSRARARARED